MAQHVVPSAEGFPAGAAGEGPLTCVEFRMPIQDVAFTEALPTRVANISLLRRVSQQAAVLTEHFPTTGVEPHVVDQLAVLTK